MKRFITVGGLSMLAVGLAVGLAFAAGGPGGGPGGMRPGGPGGQQGGSGGQGMRHQGPPPLIPAIERKLGKPLTEDQKKQIGEALKAQHESIMTERDAFAKKVAGITGLSVEKVQQLLPPPPPGGPAGPGMGGPGQGGQGQGGPGMGGPGQGGPGMGGGQGQGGPGQGGPGMGGPGMGGPGMGGPGQGGQMPPPPGMMLAKRIEQALGKPLTKDQLEQLRAAGEAHREAIKPVHEAFVKKLSEITGLTLEDLKDVLPPPPQGPPKGPPKGPPPVPPAGGAQQ
jgi:hypothetical protein